MDDIYNEYPVYPEDDGYDRFCNPYSPVWRIGKIRMRFIWYSVSTL